jgi:hypothetical protein
MCIRVTLVAVVLALLVIQPWSCPPALADKVYLKNNEIIEGLVTKETEDQVTVDFGFGQMTMERKDIVKIEKCPFPASKAEGKTAPEAGKKPAAKPPVKPATPAVKPAPPKPQVKLPPAKPATTKESSVKEGPPSAEGPPPAPPGQETGGAKVK